MNNDSELYLPTALHLEYHSPSEQVVSGRLVGSGLQWAIETRIIIIIINIIIIIIIIFRFFTDKLKFYSRGTKI